MAKNSKRGLGKGLEALIPSSSSINEKFEEGEMENRVVYLSVDKLKPNRYQPRREFDEEKLHELAESIREHGVVQPVVVRSLGEEEYEIVAGERRWRACRFLGLKTLPAVVKEYSNEELTEIALIENIQREDLNPIEEASAYNVLMHEFSFTQDQLAKKLGKSRSFIANMLRLLQLDEEIQNYVVTGKLTSGHARALLSLDEDKRTELAERIAEQNLTVRQAESLVKEVLDKEKDNAGSTSIRQNTEKEKSPEIEELEDNLREVLGTNVKIKGEQKGKVEIEFYSSEELDRVSEYILKRGS